MPGSITRPWQNESHFTHGTTKKHHWCEALSGNDQPTQEIFPDLASKTKPLRDLLSTKNQWTWGPSQQQAFEDTKKELSSPRILALYNAAAKTTVAADASSFGLGGVLCQEQPNGQWRPVSYISRSLTAVEQRYAQIEKECLAVTWACERFADF